MSHALLIFHALTGCDTVSGFVRDGKNQNSMFVQNLLLVLTDALLTLRSQNRACRLRGCTHVYMSTCMHWCEQDWEGLCPEQRIPLPSCRAQTSRNSSPLIQWGTSCHRWKAGYLCITTTGHTLTVSLRIVARPPNISCTNWMRYCVGFC